MKFPLLSPPGRIFLATLRRTTIAPLGEIVDDNGSSCRFLNLCSFKNINQSLTSCFDAFSICNGVSRIIRDVTHRHVSRVVTWLTTLRPPRNCGNSVESMLTRTDDSNSAHWDDTICLWLLLVWQLFLSLGCLMHRRIQEGGLRRLKPPPKFLQIHFLIGGSRHRNAHWAFLYSL